MRVGSTVTSAPRPSPRSRRGRIGARPECALVPTRGRSAPGSLVNQPLQSPHLPLQIAASFQQLDRQRRAGRIDPKVTY
jgi:hypothetical protein